MKGERVLKYFGVIDDGEVEKTAPDIREIWAQMSLKERLHTVGAFAASFAAVGGLAFGMHEYQVHHPDRATRLGRKYKVSHLDPSARTSFRDLMKLSVSDVRVQTIPERQKLGQEIQDDAAWVFQNSIEKGLDNQGVEADMFDVALDAIPEKTQEALDQQGFVFVGERPVDCDAPAPNGDHGYLPLDYSNHLLSDFKVTTAKVDGKLQTNIPLGTEELPSYEDPFVVPFNFNEAYPFVQQEGWALPCEELYPHQVFPPNNTTYPSNGDFSIELY